MSLIGVFGIGGFGREVMPIARASLAKRLAEFFEPELVFVVDEPTEEIVNGQRVMSTEQFLGDRRPKHFNVAVADGAARERIAKRLTAGGAVAFELRASDHVNLDANVIGEGAILCPFTTVTSNARIGRFFHLNIYGYVAHDCVVGDFVTFAPAVRCNGRVVVEDHAYIGTGAVLKQGSDDKPIVIGRGAVVGMGAVVTRSVAPGETVIGNPAAPLQRRGQ
jgi:sugar O-acyltransferase (sialic acid O-acetyltransferase NeuD family)